MPALLWLKFCLSFLVWWEHLSLSRCPSLWLLRRSCPSYHLWLAWFQAGLDILQLKLKFDNKYTYILLANSISVWLTLNALESIKGLQREETFELTPISVILMNGKYWHESNLVDLDYLNFYFVLSRPLKSIWMRNIYLTAFGYIKAWQFQSRYSYHYEIDVRSSPLCVPRSTSR